MCDDKKLKNKKSFHPFFTREDDEVLQQQRDKKFVIGIFISTLNSPKSLDESAFYMFIIFICVITSILIRSLPMAVSVLSGLSIAILFKVISLKEALSGYGNSSTWLVTIAFLLSGIIIDSGLGKRISLLCINFFGKTVIGIGYAICIAELILGPLVPSVTARGGGILAPIVKLSLIHI